MNAVRLECTQLICITGIQTPQPSYYGRHSAFYAGIGGPGGPEPSPPSPLGGGNIAVGSGLSGEVFALDDLQNLFLVQRLVLDKRIC
jgi:hypothetical protein